MEGQTLRSLPVDRDCLVQLGRSAAKDAAQLDGDALRCIGATGLSMVVVLGLVEFGFILEAAPGEVVTLTRHGAVVQPFAIMLDSERDTHAIEDLRAACASAGVEDLDLGAIAARARDAVQV